MPFSKCAGRKTHPFRVNSWGRRGLSEKNFHAAFKLCRYPVNVWFLGFLWSFLLWVSKQDNEIYKWSLERVFLVASPKTCLFERRHSIRQRVERQRPNAPSKATLLSAVVSSKLPFCKTTLIRNRLIHPISFGLSRSGKDNGILHLFSAIEKYINCNVSFNAVFANSFWKLFSEF